MYPIQTPIISDYPFNLFCRLIEKSTRKYNKLLAEGKEQHVAWNLSSVRVSAAATVRFKYEISL